MRFINAIVITNNDNFDILYNAEVEVLNNKIEYVGKTRDIEGEFIDCSDKIISAGFVNTHCHSSMTLFRNIGENSDFRSWWYDYIRPLENKSDKTDYIAGTNLAILEMIKNGITCCLDFYFYPYDLAKCFQNANMRACIGIGSPKDGFLLQEKDLDEEYLSIKKCGTLIYPCVIAHSVYSVDIDNLVMLSSYAKKKKMVFSIHASETLNEVGECDKLYGKTPIGLLEDLGVLENKCILAHCVHCDRDDINILKKYKNLYVATNPSSNLVLGSGIAPLYSYNNNKINICIGTDGVASNDNFSMFKEMFLTKNLQSGVLSDGGALDYKTVYQSATITGAKALGFKNLGKIEKGYLADLIVIKKDVNMSFENDIIRSIVNSADCSNIYMTIIDGKVLYKDYEYFVNLDKTDVIKQVETSIRNIKEKGNKN